jgi:hypothetical protein
MGVDPNEVAGEIFEQRVFRRAVEGQLVVGGDLGLVGPVALELRAGSGLEGRVDYKFTVFVVLI